MLGLASTNERAREPAIHLQPLIRGKSVDGGARSIAGYISEGIAPGHLDLDAGEPCFTQQVPISFLFECTGDTARPGFHIGTEGLRKPTLEHDVRNSEA
ncbi:MAG TPA: hypothetical protein VFA10_11810, partial [Ktedonobacteraceae bacterium]|nr:hypothetical protein [Ktedonobacteraceae bacterium]